MMRGQAWSMDLIFGVLIFLLAVGIIYALLVHRTQGDITPLRVESEVIATKLSNDPALSVTSFNQLNATRLGTLAAASAGPSQYEQLRHELGIQNEFCVFLQDELGNVVYIQGSDGNRYSGIGSGTGELNLTCVDCSGSVRPLKCGEAIPVGCSSAACP